MIQDCWLATGQPSGEPSLRSPVRPQESKLLIVDFELPFVYILNGYCIFWIVIYKFWIGIVDSKLSIVDSELSHVDSKLLIVDSKLSIID